MKKRFNPKNLEKLNTPHRLEMIDPNYIWKTIKPERHSDKVEIGAGTGVFSRAFQDISGMGKTYAIDISEDMIAWMKENITAEYPNIIPLKTDGKVLPLEDNSADVVYMITLHHEIEDQEGLLAEARRILRDDGRIFIVDFNMNNLYFGPGAEIRCNAEDVASQLKKAGFKDVSIDAGFENFFLVIAKG